MHGVGLIKLLRSGREWREPTFFARLPRSSLSISSLAEWTPTAFRPFIPLPVPLPALHFNSQIPSLSVPPFGFGQQAPRPSQCGCEGLPPRAMGSL